ncbi:hypothetical protein SEVIR_5G289900v4 [Setaria viridis]|uniref:Uncharacterized protein n=1 Tax=Setaria viridis TaxID=4556 RepID=A0A4U6UQR1_SETVI|nr:hypothetical protein SEVIR_5G289900v2 [Setaria viridis]
MVDVVPPPRRDWLSNCLLLLPQNRWNRGRPSSSTPLCLLPGREGTEAMPAASAGILLASSGSGSHTSALRRPSRPVRRRTTPRGGRVERVQGLAARAKPACGEHVGV